MDKTELFAQKQALEQRLNAIHADYRRGLSADSGEQALQLENAEVLAEIARVTRAELARIEQLLLQKP